MYSFKIPTLISTVSLLEPCPRNSSKSGRWFYFGHTEKCYLLTDEEASPYLREREVCTKYGSDIGII